MRAPTDLPAAASKTRDYSFLFGLLSVLVSAGVLIFVLRSRASGTAPRAELQPVLLSRYDNLHLARVRGAASAPDTLTEVTDFLCPACASAHRTIGAVIDSLVAEGRLVHRVLEVPFQPGAIEVSVSAACAFETGAEEYWRLRSVYFAAQRAIASAYPVAPELARIAGLAQIDTAAVAACSRVRGADIAARFTAGVESARATSVSYTPLFALNGATVPWNELPGLLRGRER